MHFSSPHKHDANHPTEGGIASPKLPWLPLRKRLSESTPAPNAPTIRAIGRSQRIREAIWTLTYIYQDRTVKGKA